MPRLSPGIFVNELDFSEFAPALGLARAMVIGGATKGPLNTPVFVRSTSELTREFGEPVVNDFGLQNAVQFLKKGNQLLYLRVADSTVAIADAAILGTSGGTPAVAATGTIQFDGSANPTDAESVTINDGSGAVAAFATITLTASQQPADGDTLEILDDGAGVAATLLVTSAGVTPTNGDTITIDDGEGNSVIFEFTTGGGLTVGDVEVDTTATATEGIAELVTAINGSALNVTAGAASGPSPFNTTITHDTPGSGANVATQASAGTNPPTSPANFSGGANGRIFEFDPIGVSAGVGIVPVTIGATALATLANLLQAINAAGGAGEVNVSGADTTGGGDPQITVTHGQPGTVGNVATQAVTGATPPTVTTPFAGGANGTAVTFEFDDDATIGAGNIGVLIGATAAATLTNLINAINASALDMTAVDGTITIPLLNLTHGTPGDQGNQTITEIAAAITVTGMTGGTDALPGAATTVMTLLASSPGTWGNDIIVDISATTVFGAPVDNFDIVVTAPVDRSGVTQVVERFTNLSLTATDARFIETVLEEGIRGQVEASTFIRADVIVSSGSPDSGQSQLGTGGGTVGADGIDALTSTDIIGTVPASGVPTGMQAIRNPDTQEFNILCIPGITHIDVINEAINIAVSRGDFIFILDPPFGLTKQEVIDWHNGLSIIVPNAPTQPIDSTYLTLNWSHIQVFDEFNQQNIFLPPSGHIAAAFAFTDQVAGPWFAAAGFNRGILDGDDVEFSPDLADRNDLLGGQNRINPIVNFADTGLVLFGNRTLLRTDSLLADVHVRRLLIHAEKLIASAVRVLVFEPNDPITWKKFEQLVNPILGNIAANRGLSKFGVVINSTLNPPAQRRMKIMRGRLNLTPIDAAEQIEIDFAVFSTGAEFTE